MSTRKTTEQFILEAISIHGDRYDYSKVSYKDNKTNVVIICPIHGEFSQSPVVHLRGCGCSKCGNKTKLLCGIGRNDICSSYETPVYKCWSRMIKRCYYNNKAKSKNAYEGCSVCDDWLTLSSFDKWFNDHYIDGWALDKDIISKGNKVYSPATCCFVPQEVNNLLTRREKLRGALPIGVSLSNSLDKPYRACMSVGDKQKSLGIYSSREKAFEAYKQAKENRIKAFADKYKEQLSSCAYQALYNYKVEITD